MNLITLYALLKGDIQSMVNKYTLPSPTETQRGGIIAKPRTTENVEVVIGDDDKLYVPEFEYKKITKSSTDTSVELIPNIFYIFPEMSELNINLIPGKDDIYNQYHFRFTSGETPTTLSLPETVKSDLMVEPNRIYECSIADNLLAWTSWAV